MFDKIADICMISKNIRHLRNLLQIKQIDFAKTIGIARSTLSDYESGKAYPSVQLILKLKKAYPQLNLNWLIADEGEPFGDATVSGDPDLIALLNLYAEIDSKENLLNWLEQYKMLDQNPAFESEIIEMIKTLAAKLLDEK